MPVACMKSLTLTHEGLEFGFAKFQFIEQKNPWGACAKRRAFVGICLNPPGKLI